MPKRPSTAWGLFFVEHLDKVRASGKAVVPTVETVVASAQWKQLSDAQKQVLIVCCFSVEPNQHIFLLSKQRPEDP